MRLNLFGVLAAAAVAVSTMGHSSRGLFAQSELTAVDNKTAKPKPAPRLGGHPDLSGYWKGTRDTRPGGNIGKDLPGWKLPLTPAVNPPCVLRTLGPHCGCGLGGSPLAR